MSSIRITVVLLAVASSVRLTASDPFWQSKPANQWTEADAKQLLTSSPWVKEIRAMISRRLTEDELREGGMMGQPRGVGNDGVDPKGSGPKVSPNVFTGAGGDDRGARSFERPITLTLRWESALPVRIAELKAHELEPPTQPGDGYRIAVYGIPGGGFNADPERLGKPLKGSAVLKREGKKDARPISVEVFQREDGMAVVYLFPLSAEISSRDQTVRFEAQIGRVIVAYTFDLQTMQMAGRREL